MDQVSLRLFEQNLDDHLDKLQRQLKDGTYRPLSLRRVHILKGPGSTQTRPLGIPTVRDRVAQEVVRQLLASIFEPQFHNNSYGFIPNRNCHMAIERVLELHRAGNHVVLDADIMGFFDNIPHQIIMQSVAAEIADGNILRLVQQFLTAGVMEDGGFSPTNIGTPQGGVISPLLANIVLNHLDWALDKSGFRFARYADDFVVVCQNEREAQEALTVVRHVLETELGLKLSPEKTKIGSYGKGYDFLDPLIHGSRPRRVKFEESHGLSQPRRHSTANPCLLLRFLCELLLKICNRSEQRKRRQTASSATLGVWKAS